MHHNSHCRLHRQVWVGTLGVRVVINRRTKLGWQGMYMSVPPQHDKPFFVGLAAPKSRLVLPLVEDTHAPYLQKKGQGLDDVPHLYDKNSDEARLGGIQCLRSAILDSDFDSTRLRISSATMTSERPCITPKKASYHTRKALYYPRNGLLLLPKGLLLHWEWPSYRSKSLPRVALLRHSQAGDEIPHKIKAKAFSSLKS